LLRQTIHGRSEIILSQFSSTEREALLRDKSALRALGALAAYSPALTQALSRRVDLARWLFLERAYEKAAYLRNMSFELSAQLREAESLTELQQGLRRFRLKEITRLAVRDLTGRADLAEVMKTLSALAEACLAEALDAAMRMTADRYGVPPRLLGFYPVVMGMGKLGGGELNYSSDVDLIYLYRFGEKAPNSPSAQSAAQAVFTAVSRAMSEVTEDGMVFRVDLDLRPGGKDGAQAQEVSQALKHYLALGQPWERLALLKARPVAGDLEAGRRFLADVEPFVYRRHLDYTTLEELKNLKARFTREKAARLPRSGGGAPARENINVKLSPGGIREIEFFAQALTLTFGGRLPHLRRAQTLETLTALTDEGLISSEDRDDLSRAYVFLRNLEHRLQLRELTQTQSLPRDPSARESLAETMGFYQNPFQELLAELSAHMGQVTQRFNALLAEPEGESTPGAEPSESDAWVGPLMASLDDGSIAKELLAKAGFRRPDAALAALTNIREEKFLPDRLQRYTANLERLVPLLLAGAGRAADPDRAILHLERFLGSIGPKAGFLVLLEENPKLIELLSILFGASEYLSGILINHPAILDSLIDRRSAQMVKSRKAMADELTLMLSGADDTETALAVIRRFKNDETLRVGLYDILGRLPFLKVQSQLTDLAEVVMERTMSLAGRDVLKEDWYEDFPLAVMGLGKLGGVELTYGSDLDLLFVLGPKSDGSEIPMETAIRLGQRLISYLSVYLDAGPGYEIDSRLRPSGRSGPLVVSPDSFKRYHATSLLWEKQALVKLRGILGPSGLRGRVRAAATRIAFDLDLPDDAAGTIDDMRRRMAKERGKVKPDQINPKFSRGGLVEVEFLTQYLQLRYGREHGGEVRSPSTRTALKALSEKGLGPKGLDKTADAYGLIGQYNSRLSLVYDRSGDRAAYTAEEISRAPLPGDPQDAAGTLGAAMDLVKETYDEVFGLRGTS
jgi:glutamate-ammonia-ligase adenylyltransferase